MPRLACTSGLLPRAAVCGALAAAVLACATVAAQSLKIPDFRQNPPEITPGPRPGERCDHCGVIRSIREIRSERPVPVPKPLQSNPMDQGPGSNMLVGAVVALPLGERSDRSYVGGVGTPEMRERFTESTYEITIRLDNGGYTAVQRRDGGSFRVGDRVRVEGSQLTLLTP
jgi:hypothetical protein